MFYKSFNYGLLLWMNKFACLLIVSVFFSAQVSAQSSALYDLVREQYNILSEDFQSHTNRSNIQVINDDYSSGKHEFGFYELSSESLNNAGVTMDILSNSKRESIDWNADFEIESSIKFVYGKGNNGNGIMWGQTKSGWDGWRFAISGNGQYIIDRWSDGKFVTIKDWTVGSNMSKGDFNKLTIRKVSSDYYFFINEALVHTCPVESLQGNDFNIFSASNSTIRIGSIRISYLGFSSNWKPHQVYGYYSNNDRENQLYEDFQSQTNRSNIQAINDTYSSGKYEFGSYKLISKSLDKLGRTMDVLSNSKTKAVDWNADFEIESSIKFVGGEDNNGNGIMWGQSKSGWDGWRFAISGDGHYKIYSWNNEKYITLKDWTVGRNISKLDFNKLTVRKVSGDYYFFINEALVHTCPFESLPGNDFMIFANQNSIIRISSIRFSYLKSKDESEFLDDENSLPPILSIQEITFSKGSLGANEEGQLAITIKNVGAGDAKSAYVNLATDLIGLQFPVKTNLPVIPKNGGTETIMIGIQGSMELQTSEAIIKIEVVEPNFKVKIQGKQVKFPTKEFLKPELVLAKFAVVENLSATPNDQIDINEQVDLKFAIQNIGQGKGEDLNVSVINNQKGVMFLGVVDASGNLVRKNPAYSALTSGKFESITYRYFVNSEFQDNQLEFSIAASEKYGKYGFTESKSVEINTLLKEEGYIRTVAAKSEQLSASKVVVEDIPDFVVDVDQNIPEGAISNRKTFAVVIGNEAYSREVKVEYALNDARVFKQYLKRTLGLPNENIHYTENATFGQMLDALKWINDVIKAYNGEAKVIFYYAGHGMPDEQTKNAYLLPCDGNSQNSLTAVKLVDVYDKLSQYPSVSVTVFLDACFSGAARDQDAMLAEGRGVRLKPRNEVIPGNIVILSACTGDETALPLHEKRHGLFTYFLLKKIQESSGNVALNELSRFVITNVTQQSVVINKKSQTPQIISSAQIQSTWQTIKLK